MAELQEDERSAAARAVLEAFMPRPAWPDPGVSHHSVQVYEEDTYLLDAVSHFTGNGLAAGEAAVVIATAAHRDQLDARLRMQGVDIATARAQGRYILLDAAETLAQFMVDGSPDAQRFVTVVGGVIARAGGRYPRVRAFGEMVALLWEAGNIDAALRLETLWNDLATMYAFSLLCAYPLRSFSQAVHTQQLLTMCTAHSHFLSAEGSTALTSPDARLRTVVQLQQQAHAVLEQRVAERTAALEREMAERQQAESQLRQQQAVLFQHEKLAAMGTLLASVAHELNNPLAVIMMQADLLQEEGYNEAQVEPMQAITQAAERAMRIVRNFLTLARQHPLERQAVALHTVLQAPTPVQLQAAAAGRTYGDESVTGPDAAGQDI